MTVTSGKLLPVGMRFCRIFALNASGSPAASSTTVYEGLVLAGAQAFTMTIPDARRIAHMGDDRVLQVDILPPTEGMTAEITAARMDFSLYATLTGTASFDAGTGDINTIGVATSAQGNEPQVGIMMYQQAIDETGKRAWRAIVMPKATIYPHPQGMDANPASNRYLVSPQVVKSHLWETAFSTTSGEEGFKSAQALIMHSEYKPKIVAWLGDNSATDFLYNTDYPAQSITKTKVWVDGVLKTSGVTYATTKITFTSAPASNARIVALYETAADEEE